MRFLHHSERRKAMRAFMEPEIEVKKFSVEDVITTSGEEWVPGEDETERT